MEQCLRSTHAELPYQGLPSMTSNIVNNIAIMNKDDEDTAAKSMDRRLEQLLILTLINSLRRREEDDGASRDDLTATAAKEDMSLDDQAAISRELMTVAQRLIDAQLLDLCRDKDKTHMPSLPALKTVQSSLSSVSSDQQQQLIHDDVEAAAIRKKKSAAAGKKKRYRKKKAAAKRRKKANRMSWLHGAGILPQIIMMALGSITTLIVCLAIIHQRVDGSRSSEGGAAPALRPTASKSLLRRSFRRNQHQLASALASTPLTPNIINTPTVEVAPPPFILPTTSRSDSKDTSIISFRRTQETCLDTPNWKDAVGDGCDWYEEYDVPGCPNKGNSYTGDMGSALENCCHCGGGGGGGSITFPPTISPTISASPTISSSPTEFCLDTPDWKDIAGDGCDWYKENDVPGCPKHDDTYTGDMGSANENCCHCGGGILPTCEDYRLMCQKYFNVLGVKDGELTELCKEAESCACNGTTHDFEIITDETWSVWTVGLYDECKCDYWLRLCEDTEEGVACDYAAEYCCGDYDGYTNPLNSPVCYCAFFNYAQNQFGHTLKPQTLSENMANGITMFSDPCQLNFQLLMLVSPADQEKISLEAIFNSTNGTNWINNSGWMHNTLPYCQWYGISCNKFDNVIGIDLRGNNLTGQFPVYTRSTDPYGGPTHESNWRVSKYGLANLYHLETLDLADNNLTGTIEYRTLYNLESLHHFDISGNQLSGGFDPLITPSISYADFSNNRFTSMHRFQSFKVSPLQTLRSLDVSNNEIKIDASDLLKTVPPNIEQFTASNNDIHGNLPASLNNLPKLRRFDMSSNSLSGELPVFENSQFVLQELDLSNQDQANGLTGPIPEELWRLQFIKILNLAGNKLTGTLPTDIVNMAVLRTFDVSNNNLSGEIPPQIGQLAGTLNYLGLANNTFSGIIPSELGNLRDASVLVRGDSFDVNSTTPLSLCKLVRVKYSDLANDTTFCPMERNALSNFYDLAKGGEWTNGTNWNDEYTSPCDWHGVECDENKQVVTELKLRNNGLSGRLSSSIGSLTFLTKLDLSDNDIKGSIPTEIGFLTQLEYLRLSYNAFTGAAPDELADLTNLQLLQLQSNRITGIPKISSLDESIHGESTFVSDCGVPSAFENALECDNCTMCCNANEDCFPQEQTQIEKWGLDYSSFAAIVFVVFTLLCCMLVFFLSRFHKQQRSASTLTMSMQEKKEQDDDYALSRIGKDSVYSYFVTDLRLGWLCAFATLVAQALILIYFVIASEVKLQDDKTDIEFTWKCPRDTDSCDDKSDLENVGWFIFSVLMIAFLAKDTINGFKLLYHSSKARHTFWARTRYFIGGLSLCTITLYALYVSIVYNSAIATSNTDIILNSVVVLFIMDMDQVIFATIEAINDKWTAHVDGSKDARSDAEEAGGTSIVALEEMKRDIASQDEKIAAQQDEIRMLQEKMKQILESQSQAAGATPTPFEPIPQCVNNESENVVPSPAIEEWQDNSSTMNNLYQNENSHDDENVRAIQTQHDGLRDLNFVEQEAVADELQVVKEVRATPDDDFNDES